MIELTVHGSAAACRTAAQSARDAASTLEAQVSTVRHATCDSWTGGAAEGYRGRIADAASALADLVDRIEPACRALDDFAGELDVVTARMADVRSRSAGAGLVISGDAVLPPSGGGGEMTVAEADAHDAKVRAYNEAFDIAQEARGKEREAHSRLVDAMEASNGDGWLENLVERLQLLPPDSMDGVAAAGYVVGLAGLGFGGLAGWMSQGVLGMWQPKFRNARGSWVWGTNKGWTPLQRLRLSLRPGASARDWRALPHQSANLGRWETAGRWANRAGGLVTGLTSGWSQWDADADDPSLDTGERVDRAATKGAGAGLGAWGGASAGAWAGGAIGTAILPGVGTVVGGAVGGLVGGAVGAYAGSELADVVNEQWDGAVHAVGDAVDAVGDGLSEAGDAIGEGLSDAGDALTFWD